MGFFDSIWSWITRNRPIPHGRAAARKALLVGINAYPNAPLAGCVNSNVYGPAREPLTCVAATPLISR